MEEYCEAWIVLLMYEGKIVNLMCNLLRVMSTEVYSISDIMKRRKQWPTGL